MTKIDNALRNQIQNDVVAALAAVAEKYGLERPMVDVRRASNGTFVRLMKLDMHVKAPVITGVKVTELPVTATSGDATLMRALARIGVNSTTNRKGETVLAYKPNRPKYPFVFQGPKGGRWKATEADIRARFA